MTGAKASASRLPAALAAARERLGISPSTAGFVLPLGTTMNMSGTALFEGCVVLFVALKAERDGKPVFHETWAMDAWGDVRGTAMGRLVSVPVSLAIEAVLTREIPAGVHGAPHDPKLLARWLDQVGHLAQVLQRIDHLA